MRLNLPPGWLPVLLLLAGLVFATGLAAGFLLECGDPALEGVHKLRDSRLGLGRQGVPDGLCERRIGHAAVLLPPRLGSNIGP